MRVRLRLAGVAVGLLLPGLVLGRWTLAVAPERPAEASIALPSQLGPWVAASEEKLEDWVLAIIEPDAYLMRAYVREGTVPVLIYVALYARWSGFGRAPHTPEGCYPASGWEIVGERPVKVPVAGDTALLAKLLRVQRSGQEETVLYWFQPAGRWPSGGATEQLRRAGDSVLGRPQFAFVRLSAPAEAGVDLASVLEFAGLVAPPIRAAVDRIGASPQRISARHESASASEQPSGPPAWAASPPGLEGDR